MARRDELPQAGEARTFDVVLNALRLTSPFEAAERRPRRLSDTDRPRNATGGLPFRLHSSSLLAGGDDVDQDSRIVDHSSPPRPDREQHECTAVDCSVAKVFHMTELQEIIFSFLEYQDILALRQVNRQCDSVIKGSSKLHVQFFFLRGQYRRPGAKFELLPLNLPGVTIQRGKELYLGQWIEVNLSSEWARRICPRARTNSRVRARSIYEGLRGGLGTRKKNDQWPAKNATLEGDDAVEYEDLLVSQPPTIGMQAFVVDPTAATSSTEEDEPHSGLRACAKLSCETGITLGFLAETALAILSQDSGPSEKSDGKVLFKSIMSFSDPDKEPRKQRSSKRTIFYL